MEGIDLSGEPTGRLERRGGSLHFWELDRPRAFLVVTHGSVGPALIREELAHVARFARRQPGGWTYLVDTTRLRFLNLVNFFLLRRIHRLPNIRNYVVVAPSGIFRAIARRSSWVVGADSVVATLAEGLALAGAEV